MHDTVRIALDAMGGDHGASVVIPGAALTLERHPDVRFVIYGDSAVCLPLLDQHPKLKAASTFHHTDVSVAMDAKPSQALRHGRGVSSMWRAIEAVKLGEADVVISAGNTGALMAMATFCLRTLARIDRPAIAALWPTARGESVVLDVGATVGDDARELVDMAIMGAAMARILFDIDRPTVGLLNIGVEDVKGVENVKLAARMLKEAEYPSFTYHGFVEGNDIGLGTVDVVVTEGFAGNIALKTAEGTAKQVAAFLRAAINRSIMGKIGYLFARQAFTALRNKLDPRKSNGGVFLGLNGIVIKSHGGTDELGFASAIDVGYDMVKYQLLHKITGALAHQDSMPAHPVKDEEE